MGVDINQVKANWFQEGFNFFLWHDPPNKNWPPITHPFDEKVLLLDGELEFVVSGESVILELGRELHVPAGAVHTVHNRGPGTNKWCYGYQIHALKNNGMKENINS